MIMVEFLFRLDSQYALILRIPTLLPILLSLVFRVKFPCTGKVTGGVLLTINISFVDVAGSEIWGPLSLTLKRQCVAGE